MTDKTLDLDKHRGMAAQKATDIRRILADAENNAKELRDRQQILENQLLSVAAASWPEAAAKARYVLNLYATGLGSDDIHHRDLVTAVLADFGGHAQLFSLSAVRQLQERKLGAPFPPMRVFRKKFADAPSNSWRYY